MKRFCIVILFFILVCNAVQAQNAVVSIRFFEQKIYFLNDDIDIKLTIKNEGIDHYRFRIADNRVFSVNFDVRTMTNKPEQYHSDYYQSERNSAKPVLYREVVLSPGEEYSTVIRFSDYIRLKEPGLYIVQALFYPDLFITESAAALPSNKLTLNVRPPVSSPEERGFVEAQVDKALQREDLPPDDIVTYMIRARMNNQWSRFFLYIDLEQLYINSYLKTKTAQAQFSRLSEEDRKVKIEWYKKQIMDGKEEWFFILLPHSFEILETNYTQFEATVKVRQVFQHPDYREPRLYTYYLKRTNNTWEIVNYIVENINTGTP